MEEVYTGHGSFKDFLKRFNLREAEDTLAYPLNEYALSWRREAKEETFWSD